MSTACDQSAGPLRRVAYHNAGRHGVVGDPQDLKDLLAGSSADLSAFVEMMTLAIFPSQAKPIGSVRSLV